MRHNSVVSGHQKSIGILRVDGLSKGPPDLGRHIPQIFFSSKYSKFQFQNFKISKIYKS